MTPTETIADRPTNTPRRLERARLSQLSAFVERFGLVLVLLATIALFTALEPDTFFTMDNLRSILASQSVLAILAIAALIPLVVGQFDLSVAAILGICSLAGGALMSDGNVPLALAVAGALTLGALLGLFNGLLVARIGVNSIITTLGTASIIAGLALWYSKGIGITSGISPNLIEFGRQRWLSVPTVFFILIAIAAAVGYLMRATPFGRSLTATGANERAAFLVGLPVSRLKVICFVLAGLVAGCGGMAQLATSGQADPSFGPNLLLPALTAVFLGSTTIRPGEYNVLGTLVAIAFLAASLSGLVLVGAPAWIEPTYNGVALIVAVALSAVLRRRRAGT